MSVSFVGHGNAVSGVGASGSGFSGTCDAPTGSAVGDLFLLICSGRADGGTITVPGDYTLVGSVQQADDTGTQHLFVYRKVAAAGDVSGGAAVSFSAEFRATSSMSGIAKLSAYRGVVYVGEDESFGVTESSGPGAVPVPDEPFGEGKIAIAVALRASGGGFASPGDYSSRYTTSVQGRHGQVLADGDYDTGVTPAPPTFTTAVTTKLSLAVVLAGTALPTPPGPNRGPFIGLRVN